MHEKDIVLGLKARQEKAFGQFYLQYKNLIYFIAFDILHDEEEAKDVLQDTLISVYQNIDDFSSGNFKAWFTTIAKRKALDKYRSKKHLENLDIEPGVEDDHSFIFADLKKILSDDEYLVLIYHAVYDIKHKDIAIMLDKPLGTITWLYQQAIKKAKQELR